MSGNFLKHFNAFFDMNRNSVSGIINHDKIFSPTRTSAGTSSVYDFPIRFLVKHFLAISFCLIQSSSSLGCLEKVTILISLESTISLIKCEIMNIFSSVISLAFLIFKVT